MSKLTGIATAFSQVWPALKYTLERRKERKRLAKRVAELEDRLAMLEACRSQSTPK
ncbi:MAG: hypothetical protein ACPG4T_14015 [Nannocystaceae bacterium]